MTKSKDGLLVCFPSLKARPLPGGRVVLTQKFVDGMAVYTKFWDGPIRCVMELSDSDSENLDNVELKRGELPFELQTMPFESSAIYKALDGASVALATPDSHSLAVAKRCRILRVPTVFTFEYSLRTRLQVIHASTRNPAVRLRRYAWQLGQERRNLAAVMMAAGVQCNGTPTYDAYRGFNRNAMLFFDSRVTREMLVTPPALALRLKPWLRGSCVRLAYSGRLDPMKGVQYLVPLAKALQAREVDFKLTIFGDGPLASDLQREIFEAGLGHVVKLAGVLDFKTALMPTVRSEVDLFVCPHVQGDPSCTYLETAACGVPIVGFDNDAFAGLLKRAPLGWAVRMGNVDAMARQIEVLAKQRGNVADCAKRAVRFAANHTFEATFQARMEHVRACALTHRFAQA